MSKVHQLSLEELATACGIRLTVELDQVTCRGCLSPRPQSGKLHLRRGEGAACKATGVRLTDERTKVTCKTCKKLGRRGTPRYVPVVNG